MSDRFAPLFAELRRTVLESKGVTTTALRRAAAERGELPDAIGGYVTLLHEHADRIGDADIAALQKAGYDDDAIFEITVAAAVGAASHRCARALAVLDEEWER
jgi:alkylhydroperoxidase family enzyme